MSTAEPETAWPFRRREQALRAARAARDALMTAMFELDAARRSQGVQSELAALDASPTGQRLRAEFLTLGEGADAATAAYWAVLSEHEVDTADSVRALREAEQALAAVTARLRKVTAQLEEFGQRCAPQALRVETELGRLRTRAAQAAAVVAQARTHVSRVTGLGLRPTAAVDALRKAEVLAGQARAGAARVGSVDALLTAATAAERHAGLAVERADALVAARERARQELSAARTRWEVLIRQSETLPAALSRLRRRYALGAFADLEAAPEQVDSLLARARAELAAAQADLEPVTQDFDRALAATARARTALSAAAERVSAVTGRAGHLQSVAADPAGTLAKARFAVRDTQRLLVQQVPAAVGRYAPLLDKLAARLDAAERMLEAPHPNWLAYDQVLQDVRAQSIGLVGDLRADIARRRGF